MTQLKRQLNLPETVAMSVALMAPTTGMVFVTPLLASAAGYNVPLAFVVSLVSVMIVGYCFGRLGRKYAHAGSAYGLTRHSLGSQAGVLAGYGLLFTYVLLTGALLAGTGAFAELAIEQIFHTDIAWGWFAGGGAAIVLGLAINNLRPSVRLMLLLEVVSMAMVTVVSILIIGHSHLSASHAVKPFLLNHDGVVGIAHALVFGLTSFLGFEGSATLGEESKDPKRMVPMAILLSALVGGLFFIFVSYSQTVGFGLSSKGVADFVSNPTPFNTLAIRYLGTSASAVINVGAAISFFACALASVNGSSHILFALSRDGYVPKRAGILHAATAVPRNAIAVTFPVGVLLLVVGWRLWTSPVTVIGDLSGLATFGALIAYGLVVIASIKDYWAEDVAARRWMPSVLSLIGLVALAWVLYGNVYPVPPSPVRYFPYIALAYFIIAMGFSFFYRKTVVPTTVGADAHQGLDAYTESTSMMSTLATADLTAAELISEGAQVDAVIGD
jgi:amino acid transporter